MNALQDSDEEPKNVGLPLQMDPKMNVLKDGGEHVAELKAQRRRKPTNKNRICMQMARGCSSSTFVATTVHDLIDLHNAVAWVPTKEFLCLEEKKGANRIIGQTYCTDLNGKEHKWEQDPQRNLQAAWKVLSGNVTCQPPTDKTHNIPHLSQTKPTILFFDGHKEGRMVDVMPFLHSLGASHARVYGLRRTNALERLICKVRDCFSSGEGSAFYPVNPDGTKSKLCFSRRSKQLPESEYQVYLDPNHVLDALQKTEEESAPWERAALKNALGSEFFVARSEALSEYEFDNSTAALNESADEFAKILRSMDIDADVDIIKKHLNPSRGTRIRHNVQAAIHNVEAVRKALVNTDYEGLV